MHYCLYMNLLLYVYPGKVSILLEENAAALKQERHCWSVDVPSLGCDSCWLLGGPEQSPGLGEVYSPP